MLAIIHWQVIARHASFPYFVYKSLLELSEQAVKTAQTGALHLQL
jgi:hypothetical protein